MLLGIYSADLPDKYFDPEVIPDFSRKDSFSKNELLSQIKSSNQEIFKLTKEIVTRVEELEKVAGENTVKELLGKRRVEWEKIEPMLTYKGKRASEFLSHTGSPDEFELSIDELEDRITFSRISEKEYREKGVDIAALMDAEEKFKKKISNIIVNHMSEFEGYLDTLQELHIKRALILGELDFRKQVGQLYPISRRGQKKEAAVEGSPLSSTVNSLKVPNP